MAYLDQIAVPMPTQGNPRSLFERLLILALDADRAGFSVATEHLLYLAPQVLDQPGSAANAGRKWVYGGDAIKQLVSRRTPMRTYRVQFFKTLTNSYGRSFEVCQRSLDVSSARGADEAVESAKTYFEMLEHVPNWSLHADYFEVRAMPGVVLPPVKQVTESVQVSGSYAVNVP